MQEVIMCFQIELSSIRVSVTTEAGLRCSFYSQVKSNKFTCGLSPFQENTTARDFYNV